jgi:hypothetical protein
MSFCPLEKVRLERVFEEKLQYIRGKIVRGFEVKGLKSLSGI